MVPRPAWVVTLGVIAGLSTNTLAAEDAKPSPRFALEANIRPLAVSKDGRFALDASARFAPEAKSADGRFTLKAVNVPNGGCDASPAPLFANGFESP